MVTRHDPTFDEAFDDLFAVAERVARRIAGAGEAQDVAAEVMGRTFARWSRVEALPYRRAWVARVAFNEALDAHRRAQRRSGARASAPSTRDMADDLAVRLALNEALAKLPKRQREVVALRYLADLTEADTASVLGLTVGTVKQHGRRALQAMRERLGVDPTFGWEE
jgi:RNA polymerase sigma-70 factor (ECF subfamily)